MSEDQLIADTLNRIEKKLDTLAEIVHKNQGAVGAILYVGSAIVGAMTFVLGWMGLIKH